MKSPPKRPICACGTRAASRPGPTALLRAVAAWREREAAGARHSGPKPAAREVVIELAQRPPRRLTDFRRVRGFPEAEDVSLGPPILDALNVARALPEEQLPPPLRRAGRKRRRVSASWAICCMPLAKRSAWNETLRRNWC